VGRRVAGGPDEAFPQTQEAADSLSEALFGKSVQRMRATRLAKHKGGSSLKDISSKQKPSSDAGGLRIHVRRVERDARAIADLEREVREFLAEVEQRMEPA
jgi:hypothetical protein